MQKELRSLIQEIIPLQLRVDLVVLSKRRDLSNKEKMDKLLNLLRDYNINNVVQLGLGTNRYGFKIGYFVVKYALDKHGAVDNLNEFIYAKKVYPNGIKIHEVMENGILCVCEYIQPFSSFSEMLVYKEKIRKILKDLSSYYLIGDVGLEAKNYANWGLRPGTDDPVMLDYAYIYDVKSELFVCRQKGCGGILIPDDDYTYLYCNHCKTKRSFASLRDMIKNTDQTDLFHNLSQYGYEMEKSNEIVELDPSRSIYLQRRIKKPKHLVNTQTQEDFNFNDYNPLQEETTMDSRIITVITDENEIRKAKILPIKVFKTEELNSEESDIFSSVIEEVEEVENEEQIPDDVDEYDDVIDESVNDDSDEEVVYTCHIDDSSDEDGEETFEPDYTDVEDPSSLLDINDHDTIIDEQNVLSFPENKETVLIETKDVEEVTPKKDNSKEVVQTKAKPVSIENLKYFEKNIGFCISKVSNTIRDYFANRSQNEDGGDDLFEMVSSDIKNRRMLRDDFYKEISHSAFKAFRLFLHLKDTDPNAVKHDSNSLMFEDGFLDDPESKEYYPTIVFLYRWFSKISLNEKSAKIALQEYNEIYSDYNGIQKEWLSYFKTAFTKKVNINQVGAIIVGESLEEKWCTDSKNLDVSEEVTEDESLTQETQETIEEKQLSPIPDTSDIDEVNEELLQVIESEEELEDDAEEDYEEDDNDEDPGISVSVFINSEDVLFDGCYVTGITDDEAKVDFAIPIYGNINNVDVNATSTGSFNVANGYWDWMTNFMTDLYFKTNDPDKYMELNEEDCEYKFVIVHAQDNEFILGIYPFTGITLHQGTDEIDVSEDPNYLAKVNKFINDTIGNTPISMHEFHQNIPDAMMTDEEEITKLFDYESDEEDEIEEIEEDETDASVNEEAMQAAIDFANRNKASKPKTDDDTLPVIHRK